MQRKPLNVLIIDDSPSEHELYREYLNGEQHCDYNFFDAYTGEEGERLFRDNPVDCIILDFRLPDTDGLELLKRLSQLREMVPAVMLTREGSETIAVITMKTGLQDYLPKRLITPQTLRRMIERAVERSALMLRMEDHRRNLERSNQDLERFANVVAHDLKSPLRAISQHLQLVRDRNTHLDEKSLKSIAFAVDGAERMRTLIEALFDFSRAGFERRGFSPIDCNQMMQNVLSNLASDVAESGAAFTVAPLPVVLADPVQIMQILQNLVGNAIKFCRDAPRVQVSVVQEADMWVFCVRDNGIGIPKVSQNSIFTIFKRLHAPQDFSGHGVGLAICERLLQNNGGRIWVESEPGQGSAFYFSLPVAPSVPQEYAA